jgi:YVTN family beta-propeller protein
LLVSKLGVFRWSLLVVACFGALLVACGGDGDSRGLGDDSNPLVEAEQPRVTAPPTTTLPPIRTVPGMPSVVNPNNLYSETTSDKVLPFVADDLPRVYVPNRAENSVSVIDPATMQVIDKFSVGINPQHIVPSWDLKTLWVTNTAEGRTDGSLTPIDPNTGAR